MAPILSEGYPYASRALDSEGRASRIILYRPNSKFNAPTAIRTVLTSDDWRPESIDVMVNEARSTVKPNLSQYDLHFVLKDGLLKDEHGMTLFVLMGISYNFLSNQARIEARGKVRYPFSVAKGGINTEALSKVKSEMIIREYLNKSGLGYTVEQWDGKRVKLMKK
ncbi:MAG TPA: hypothetical protein VJI97_03510 [Candidatus Nanoarchaeia archaeon]|nr:hypothetical protein [Candidatus Nanoarchaeia archaeon]